MSTSSGNDRAGRPKSEFGLGQFAVTVLLVVGILIEILYLTKDLAVRADLTEEGLYSLSESTQKVLSRLEKPLIIEAYFGRKIPGHLKEERKKIVNLLDEYRRMGGGKVKLFFYDPFDDESIREKAVRLGIESYKASDFSQDSLQVMEVFQGIRLKYGGDRQYVVPLILNSLALETTLTPKIQELVVGKRPKIAILARTAQKAPSPFMQQSGPPGWNAIQRPLEGRYEVVQMDVSDGKLLPDDLDLLVLIEPKKLTDWEKYCIDQHLMRGGNLLVLEDVADYQVDRFGSFMRNPFEVDAPESTLKWTDQLAAYGVQATGKLVADLFRQGMLPYLQINYDRWGNPSSLRGFLNPFWFRLLAVDWPKYADQLTEDPAAAEKLAKELGPSIDGSHPVVEGIQEIRFFWPTEVRLADKLPAGVEGSVLLRTSPLALTEDPPYSASPTAPGFLEERLKRLNNEPRKQVPLMVALKGTFESFFKGKPVPKRPGQEEDENGAPFQNGTATQPAAAKGAENRQGDAQEEDTARAVSAQDAQAPASKPAGEAGAAGESEQEAPLGPPAPEAAGAKSGQAKKDELPPKLEKAKKPARLVVIGDASFLRDDFIQGIGPARTPNAGAGGPAMFMNLLDWLLLDLDLVELRNKRAVDRTMQFVAADLTGRESPEDYQKRVAAKKSLLRILNILGPVVVLVGGGFIVLLVRSKQKRRFLEEMQAPAAAAPAGGGEG